MKQTAHFFGRVIARIGWLGRRNKLAVLSSAAVIAVALSFLLHVAALAQQKYEGQWLIEGKPGAAKVNLSLHYRTGKNRPDDSGFNSNTSFELSLAQFLLSTEVEEMPATDWQGAFQYPPEP